MIPIPECGGQVPDAVWRDFLALHHRIRSSSEGTK